jgi:hypothetical protein
MSVLTWEPVGLFDVVLRRAPPVDSTAFLDDRKLCWFLITTTDTLNGFAWAGDMIVIVSEAAPRGVHVDPLWSERVRGRIYYVPQSAVEALPEGPIDDYNTRFQLYDAVVRSQRTAAS